MAGGDDDEYGSTPSWNMMTICTVGGVLFFNVITRQLEAAAHGNKQSKELLEAVYRELSVLGIVAFVLWSINSSPYVKLTYDNKHLFEVIHMTLFLAAVFHSFFVVLVSLYSRQVSKRWEVFEDDEMKRYKELKQQHRRTAQALGLRHSTLKRGVGPLRQIWLWIRHPSLSRRMWQLSENVSYHALRSHFIKTNNLPRNFRFASYLQKCEQEVVIEMAEVKESVWIGFILVVGFELYIKGIMGDAETGDDVRVLFLISAVVVMLSALAIHFKLGKIYRALLYSYTTNTDRRDDFMQFLSADTGALLRQQDMFWFGKPDLMLIALQTMQFLLAIMVSLIIWFGVGETSGLVIVGETLLCLGALVIYSVVLPNFIPAFTMVTHVGEMVNRHILSESLAKQKKAFRRRTLPPTLRQVNLLARMKNKEQEAKRGPIGWLRYLLSGHLFREFMLVFLSVHFFLVAYNTDAIANEDFRTDAYTAECVFAGTALFIEICTHFIAWGGAACFTGGCMYDVASPPHMTASSVYPSVHRVNGPDKEMGKLMHASTHSEPVGWRDAESLRKRHSYVDSVTRCSFWACFGSRGESRSSHHGFVPPDAAVGFWRTVDALLVVAVTGATIGTGVTDGSARVVCHALQGLVILRLMPLQLCPLPHDSSSSHELVEDHHPLNKKERAEVIEETLKLLRGQNAHGPAKRDDLHGDHMAPIAGTELNEKNMKSDGVDGVVVASAVLPRPHETGGLDRAALIAAAGAEEKDDTGDVMLRSGRTDLNGTQHSDIAKVGVAMALREACTSHPDVVTRHGPLSAPILRAMLGLDPHQTGHRDNSEAFAIAAQAMTIGIPGGSLGGGRDMDMVAGPPSPSSSSSSSEDEMSSPESRRGRQRSGVSIGGIRTGRLPSWLGGGRARDDMLGRPAHNAFENGDEEDYRTSAVDNAGAWKWVHTPEIESGGVSEVHALGETDRSDSYIGPLVSSATESRNSSYPRGLQGNAPLPQATWHPVGGKGSARGLIQRPRINSAGATSWTGAAPGIIDGSGRVSNHSRHRNKRRGTSSRRKSSFTGSAIVGDESLSGSGMMASEKEDLERPVLPSFASSTGGWTGGYSPSHGHGSGHAGGGGGIPYSSYHRGTSGASSRTETPSRGLSRTITPSRITRVFVGDSSSAARVGPPHRSASDLGSATTTATAVTSSTPLDSGSGSAEMRSSSASRNAE